MHVFTDSKVALRDAVTRPSKRLSSWELLHLAEKDRTSVGIAFLIMYGQGLSANIMSLGGITIAVGAMFDAVITAAAALLSITLAPIRMGKGRAGQATGKRTGPATRKGL